MTQVIVNPFLEGSKEVPPEEALKEAKMLLDAANAARSKTSEIKEKAEKARFAKEAALKAEAERLEAEVAATREKLIKTVANIPRADDGSSNRPAPPPLKELDADLAEVLGAGKANASTATYGLVSDFVFAALAITSVFLILQDLSFT